MTLTRKQKAEVLELLAANIRAEKDSELSTVCGDSDDAIGAVGDFMESVADWIEKNHPSQ